MIERCFDYRRIGKFYKDPWITGEVLYLMEIQGGIDMGVWALEPDRDGLSIHARMGEDCRGRKAIESAKSAFRWVFENTDIRRIYAFIPDNRTDVRMVAACAGMRLSWSRCGWKAYLVETV